MLLQYCTLTHRHLIHPVVYLFLVNCFDQLAWWGTGVLARFVEVCETVCGLTYYQPCIWGQLKSRGVYSSRMPRKVARNKIEVLEVTYLTRFCALSRALKITRYLQIIFLSDCLNNKNAKPSISAGFA